MGSTDFLRLNELKIFKELRESLPKAIDKTLNLLAVRDGVLFTWDFLNTCVLSLNVKAARSRDGDHVSHQKLLPLCPPLFNPEFLVVNEAGTLLAVAGPNGILVLQLPGRCPPYGAFDNNKEVVYCRSHSLDERLLSYSETVEVKQVKFHPGSADDNHVVVLTSDNLIRFYQIENEAAVNIGIYRVGEQPCNVFPGSKTTFLDMFGEVAVDFDFGHPEVPEHTFVYDSEDLVPIAPMDMETRNRNNKNKQINVQTQTPEKIIPLEKKNERKVAKKKLNWPIYVLRGDCSVYVLEVELIPKSTYFLKGPLPFSSFDGNQNDATALLCLNTVPEVFCIALSNGTLCHAVILDLEDSAKQELKDGARVPTAVPGKELIAFESLELELGLITNEEALGSKYKCRIFLNEDESRVGRYFATHNTGLHSVTLSCIDDLQEFVSGPDGGEISPDMFSEPSQVEYLICTKTSSIENINPIIGFSVYFDPSSVIALLSDGSLITLGMIYEPLPPMENLVLEDLIEVTSPLKKMLKEPFDEYIRKILKKAGSQPVLKLSAGQKESQESCYELLQRAAQSFRDDYFPQNSRAREELEKRVQILTMMKKNQLKEIEAIKAEEEILQEKISDLAEKYEDTKDKQEELLKRCENLLMLVSRKKNEPSDAERAFMKELEKNGEKVAWYANKIDKIKSKVKYQQIQMENWKAQETKKVAAINEKHSKTIKTNLEECTKKISTMVKEVNEYKKMLGLK